MDIDSKKTILLKGSHLYNTMIKLAPGDVIRRYLAFRIIVNAMSFEDIIQDRHHPRLRKIRDTLLAHKQEGDFFEGYRAVDEITDKSISGLLNYMKSHTTVIDEDMVPLEFKSSNVRVKLESIIVQVFERYAEDFLDGFRIMGNFLCYTGSSVHEISTNSISDVFFRYNSSMSLYQLFQYIFNNTYHDPDFLWTSRHAKLDMVLYAQNMADCALKDNRNRHSIDGLLEAMTKEGIGDPSALSQLLTNSIFQSDYQSVRSVRNKFIGHMDRSRSVASLTADLDNLEMSKIHNLVDTVDRAVYLASRSHIAIGARYSSANTRLNDDNVVDIHGLETGSYYKEQ